LDLSTNGIIRLKNGSSILKLTGGSDGTQTSAASLVIKGTRGIVSENSTDNYYLNGITVSSKKVASAKAGIYTTGGLNADPPDATKDLMIAAGFTEFNLGQTSDGSIGVHGYAVVAKSSNDITITGIFARQGCLANNYWRG
jgi:hypothetical protein